MPEATKADSHESPGVNSGTAPDPPPRNTVILRVGEKRYVVRPETLTRESLFFEALLSGRWSQAEADGSYFVDYDSKVFDHVLRYLRLGSYPLCLAGEQTLDLALYAELLTAADYFGIDDLTRWLEARRYKDALKFRYVNEIWPDQTGVLETSSVDVVFQDLQVKKFVWKCPGRDPEHTEPEHCKRALQNGMPAVSPCTGSFLKREHYRQFYEEQLKPGYLVMRKEVIINYEVLQKD